MLSSSSSLSALSRERTTSDLATVAEVLLGHTVEFGTSRIYSGRVHFGGGVGRALGDEEVSELEGELVVFEAFFTASLCLPMHQFVVKVLQLFEVQLHQLTLNAMVALAKFMWVEAHTVVSLRQDILPSLEEEGYW
jgi:hypothetical protein